MIDGTEIAEPVREEIASRLNAIFAEEGVLPLLAIESGSRAWGFPSPDSDYDVRFVYLRPVEEYLALYPPRDVIERPICDEIDLNGWDVRKALDLLVRHNAVLSEWIESPLRYREHDPAIGEIAALADRFFNPNGYALHYASLARKNAKRWIADAEAVPVKKYFYSLRPALAIRALRLDPSRRPPMRLQDLVEATDLSPGISAEIAEMVAMKSSTREAGLGHRRTEIDRLIFEELDRASEVQVRADNDAFAAQANALFVELAQRG